MSNYYLPEQQASVRDSLCEAVCAAVGRLRNVSLRVGQLSGQDLGYTVSHHIPLLSRAQKHNKEYGPTHQGLLLWFF